MFAVMKTGGKQYKVQAGDTLRVEKLAADAGETVQFNDVLMIGGETTKLGTPFVAGAAVQAEIVDQIKGDKVIHFVKRRRKHSSQRTKGHRQQLTLLRVTEILAEGGDATGVKAAVGAGALAAGLGAERYTQNKTEQAEMSARVATAGEAEEKPMSEATDPVVDGTRPSNLLTEARNGQPDDLKKISGVGPKLEGLLHENGVFHFDQIAAWSAEEIAYMDDKLSFKGRIERDNWIEQAAGFAKEQE
ncbi:50S ribosomal protein L21 [Pseudoponticoccus marisrubri]|uniref:Large ribosomal subunit protein bL21 n=1 Tax=Pseudoponticoccus marisrubri TaxID=1685382 RepID=A0A0W7WLJ8_9RHOB|nr:50S ribosomal protein L21 [Pseudoponticoccus marisrubri]KUF11409.1 50S ribosomal protein L21 [Pseudoponticoccus marisrubri]